MPWKERSIVEERMRFVLRLKDGESMASLCREFGISRVTGYKIYERYKECGLDGLTDRARTPVAQIAQRCSCTCLQHHPRHHGPSWAGHSTEALPHQNRRYSFIPRKRSECFVVHRLQGRVHAGG
jgi:hypothetical protein